MSDDDQEKVKDVVDQIVPFLQPIEPNIAGSAIGTLLAMYLSAYHPDVRDELWDAFDVMVEEMIDVMSSRPDAAWRRQ